MEIGPSVLEKKIFEGFFTIYGCGGLLGHVTKILQKKKKKKKSMQLSKEAPHKISTEISTEIFDRNITG